MEKLNKTNVKKMLLIDEKFNSLLDECRTAIKQAFIDNVRIINTARFTIYNNEGNIIIVDPVEDVKQNLNEIRSIDKLMDIITEISHI
jgi:hypothetical protein